MRFSFSLFARLVSFLGEAEKHIRVRVCWTRYASTLHRQGNPLNLNRLSSPLILSRENSLGFLTDDPRCKCTYRCDFRKFDFRVMRAGTHESLAP